MADELSAVGSAAQAAAAACGGGALEVALANQRAELNQVIGRYSALVADWGAAVDASAHTYREVDEAAAAGFARVLMPGDLPDGPG